jgi:glycosyltransferase involved in cell wall biosynthesis
MPQLSVVLPAYNEEEIIEDSLGKVDHVVRGTGYKYELIVVDDGSMDGTAKKATKYAKRNGHIRVLSYEKNSGKGHAVKSGFLHAQSDIVVFMDGDLEVEPEQIGLYVKALEHADIVIGSKWLPQSKVKIPLIRRILSHGFNIVVKLLVGIRFSDTQTGLKAVKKRGLEKVFSKLTVKRYAFDVELLAVANLLGLRIVELPVKIRLNGHISFKEMWKMLIDVLGIAYRLRVKKWYQARI